MAETAVRDLHDGSGYTCLRDGALLRVRFGSHLVEQIDPKLPDGERLWHYRISPNGKHLLFVSHKGGTPAAPCKVSIASYRDRFMKVNEVARHVSEDPQPPTEVKVYLHDLSEPMIENGTLSPVFTHKYSGPRDRAHARRVVARLAKIAFAVFQQSSAEVRVLTAELGAELKKGGKRPAKPAKVVHRFTHTGGPNTPSMMRPRFLADSRHLVLLTEVSGFRHLHVLDPLYESLDQATFGLRSLPHRPVEGPQIFLWTATKEHPSRLDVYRVDLPGGKMEALDGGRRRLRRRGHQSRRQGAVGQLRALRQSEGAGAGQGEREAGDADRLAPGSSAAADDGAAGILHLQEPPRSRHSRLSVQADQLGQGG